MVGVQKRKIQWAILIMIVVMVTLCTATVGKIIYVDADATGANNGSSWENAYWYLQNALTDAWSGDEIRVAKGIYKPDRRVVAGRPARIVASGDREAPFQLINGVVIRGGYAGLGELYPDVRDIELYQTVLSGDLNGDDIDVNDPRDLLNEPTRAENSYHVVTSSSSDETTVLDGFTIMAGNADGPILGVYPNRDYSRTYGAGMYNNFGSPTVTNCTFSENLADSGGGVCNWYSNPTITNCTFSVNRGSGVYNHECNPTLIKCTFTGNSATHGGGIYNWRSSPTVTNCTFSENLAGEGGGMHNFVDSSPTLTNCTFSANSGSGMENWENSNPTLIDCTFSENSSNHAGGMQNWESSPTLINCTFSGNSAWWSAGGGMFNLLSSPTLANCTFSGNSARSDGGGMYNSKSSTTLTNCIFGENSAESNGGGMYNWDSSLILTNCTIADNSAQNGNALACDSGDSSEPSNVNLINCILWDGGNEVWNNDGSIIDITYSSVRISSRGPWPGAGNIRTDPLFVDPAAGDYHLKSEAGRWDPVSESWVQDGITSPCIDAGDPTSPVGEEPLPNGGIINMGAYGGTAEASKSPSSLHAKYGGGTGEPNDPYQIATTEELMLLGDSPEDYDKHFILTADIDLDPNLPGRKVFDRAIIGNSWFAPFTGVFDGNGHVISNLNIQGSGQGVFNGIYFGLFGQLQSEAEVRNLGVDGVYISISGIDIYTVGGIVGGNFGNVIQCYSTGSVIGCKFVGGLVGHNGGDVTVCYSTCAVTGTRLLPDVTWWESWWWQEGGVGGLVGYNTGSIAMSCSTGSVKGSGGVGGMVGFNYGGRVTHCYSTGEVIASRCVGGFIGVNVGGIAKCYSTGIVSGGSYTGGLVGISEQVDTNDFGFEVVEGTEIGCFWDIETSGQTYSDSGNGKTTTEMQTASTFLEAGWDFVGETDNGSEDIWWILEGQDYPRLWWERSPSDMLVIVVDDFESYNDLDNRILDTWIDGWGIPINGCTVAILQYPDPCWGLEDCDNIPGVYGGEQSIAFFYDNTIAEYSEATSTPSALNCRV